MKSNDHISQSYKLLYDNIIGELLAQICSSRINYCVKNRECLYAMGQKFDNYAEKARSNMSGTRLDRHKLASCICGAIIEVQPLEGYKKATIVKNANERFALHTGLSVLKFYMIYDFLHKRNISSEKQKAMHRYLKDKFELQLPSLDKNICDTQEYAENIYNALYWSHSQCDIAQKECFRYDIWAYAKIFYHLELYNKKPFQEACQELEKLSSF